MDRRVALHPGLVRLARQLYEVNLPVLPPAADIDSRLEGVRRIEQQVANAARTTFVPGPELTGELQQAAAWAGDQSRKVEEIRTLLRTLTEEAKVKVTTATLTAASPTLEAAIQRLTESELATTQQALATQTAAARETASNPLPDSRGRAPRHLTGPTSCPPSALASRVPLVGPRSRRLWTTLQPSLLETVPTPAPRGPLHPPHTGCTCGAYKPS